MTDHTLLTLDIPTADLPHARQLVEAIDAATERESRLHRARALAVEVGRIEILDVPPERTRRAAELALLLLDGLRKAVST